MGFETSLSEKKRNSSDPFETSLWDLKLSSDIIERKDKNTVRNLPMGFETRFGMHKSIWDM